LRRPSPQPGGFFASILTVGGFLMDGNLVEYVRGPGDLSRTSNDWILAVRREPRNES
jgi:hypothetical protein